MTARMLAAVAEYAATQGFKVTKLTPLTYELKGQDQSTFTLSLFPYHNIINLKKDDTDHSELDRRCPSTTSAKAAINRASEFCSYMSGDK